MAPIRRKLVAPIAAIALLLQNVGGFLAVDPPRGDGSSSWMKHSVQTAASNNGFSRHGHQQLPSCVNQGQWSCTTIAAFARHPRSAKVSFTILASRSQRGAGGNANSSSQQGTGAAADRATRVREMAAFVTASLTQTLLSRMDPTKEVSPQEERALADLLGAVLKPPPPPPPAAAPTESSETYHDASSENAKASDLAVTVTPSVASLEVAAVDKEKDFEDQLLEKELVVDEAVVKTPPKVVASEPTAIDDNEDAMPPKPRLEAALKKALERSENVVEDKPTTTSSTSGANPDETPGMAVSTLEKAKSLHQREGDRVVALKDEFATEEVVALSNEGETTTTTTVEEDHTAASIVTTDGPLRKLDTVQNLVPPTPEAISTAFGRPLPVMVQDLPPLKSIPELTMAEKTTAAPTGTSSNKSAAGFSSNEENAETANNATMAAAAAAAGASTRSSSLAAEQKKIVKDEDAYGE